MRCDSLEAMGDCMGDLEVGLYIVQYEISLVLLLLHLRCWFPSR